MKKIGIFGGSFDPIHNSHLLLAASARYELKLDTVLFVPCNISNHKDKVIQTSSVDRISMVSICMSGNFKYCPVDIYRGGISYTLDTVKDLKDKFPNDELFLLGGPDCAITFDNWKASSQIKKYAKPVFASYDFKCPILKISSTLIRSLNQEGKPITGLVPSGVELYIKNMKLYRNKYWLVCSF